jgi:hypothetical protein
MVDDVCRAGSDVSRSRSKQWRDMAGINGTQWAAVLGSYHDSTGGGRERGSIYF